MKGPWRKRLALCCTAAILVALYAHIDLHLLLDHLLNVHPGFFGLALLLFLPQILVTSLRWHLMIHQIHPMSLKASIELVMAGKALNALLPSKLGEMSKAYFLKREARVDIGRSLSAVILEKVLDMGGLCTVLLLGVCLAAGRAEVIWIGAVIAAAVLLSTAAVFLIPLRALGNRLQHWDSRLSKVAGLIEGWDSVLTGWKGRGGALPAILGLSVLLWCLHVLQIYLFFPSLGHPVPVAPALAYIPLGILAGLLPITIGGMGTRDSALIFLFAPYAGPPLMAGVGLLCSMRYWVDTLLGVPFFHQYTNRINRAPERDLDPHDTHP